MLKIFIKDALLKKLTYGKAVVKDLEEQRTVLKVKGCQIRKLLPTKNISIEIVI